MVVFNGTDTISHAMWKFMDPAHPLHHAARAEKYGPAIRDYYAYLDGKLAAVVNALDDDTILMVMSDHGFGPFHKFIHVNNWLIQKDFMRVKPAWYSRLKHRLFQLGFAPMNVYNLLMSLGLGALKREVVRGQGQGLLKTLFLSFEDVDWRRTVAYSLGNIGQININLVGREPFGCVQPGPEYEAVRTRIMNHLMNLRDPATGETVVEAVYRREDVYSGKNLESAPDILFMPRRLEYFGFGEYEFGSHQIIEPVKRGISGTHRMNGIFMAHGRAINAGLQIDNARIIDLAPTILHVLGVPLPAHLDGRVLTEILSPGFKPVPAASAQNRESGLFGNGDGDGLSEADKQVLADRLRNLGYVG